MDKKLQEKMAENNILFLHSRLSDDAISEIVFNLMSIAAGDPKAEIQIFMTGSLEYGRAMPLYDAIRSIPNPVFGIGMGQLSEFTVLLLSACSHRAALPHARLVFSETYGILDAGSNQQTEVLIAAREASKENEEYVSLLAKHTGHPKEEIRKAVDEEQLFTASEALAYGLVDEIIQ